MSNYLSIAATTAVFSQKIQAALNKVQSLSSAAQVNSRRPEKHDGQMVGVNLYLYEIEFNNALRNNDLATRRADGTLIQQPLVPLNLKYHLSFYGDDSTLETQRMMGATIVELHAQPFITRDEITQYLLTAGTESIFAQSNLQNQNARIKIEPITLSMEDVTKMWSSLFQLPHQHSLNYEVSVILMESDFPIEKVLPVKEVDITYFPGPKPQITSLSADYLPYTSDALTLELQCLGADSSSEVLFEEINISVKVTPIANNLLQILIPEQIKPGLNHLKLSKSKTVNSQQKLIYSEPVDLVIQPKVGHIEYNSNADVEEQPQSLLITEIFPFPEQDQSVTAWLNNDNMTKQHYQLDQALKIPLTCNIKALNHGDIGQLSELLRSQGITLTNNAKISNVLLNKKWLIQDLNQYFTLHTQTNGQVLVCYGFQQLPSMNALAFKAENIAPGNYLVRVQIDNLKYGISPLLSDLDPASPSFNQYIKPKVNIE
ncbi:MAG: hypothetical protein ACI9LM_002313 [Alteromonadaceae bacterium]|jgi:hypothetical protein